MGNASRAYKRLRSWAFGAHRQATKRFHRDRATWLKQGGEITHSFPIITDFSENAGQAKGHYFHQDLLVASLIHASKPTRHVDVGSRIDGFVAHVASFREIEVIDIRPLPPTAHNNIRFLQMDLMNEAEVELADSISCLHAIEHFGLGRYGDPIAVDGHVKGISNLVKMLKPGGTLYISVPIGKGNEVHFNAHRVMDPRYILDNLEIKSEMNLKRFDYVDDKGDLHTNGTIEETIGRFRFGCGIYTLQKNPYLPSLKKK
ncbi:DUF268 domain-containing protein [Ruegeria arenilitoris]|uniref:DUF268 domain-containing protein n=1 Tax=Ruegeria arenilitoris TaxID=1173585 RepID=UPI001479E8FF|nr:DUF268 domain-containing protein [Ruegeria arenilitoris]